MNTKLRNSIIAAAALLLAADSAWSAASDRGCKRSGGRAAGCTTPGETAQAPEIDAGSGTAAIALVSGVLLLMRERARSKRPSQSDENEE